jgi:hypothetical protein
MIRGLAGLSGTLLALAGCSLGPPSGRYAGASPACASVGTIGGPTSTLMRVGDQVAYAPTDGALVVKGLVGPTGSFAGSLAARGANAPGAGPSGTSVSQPGSLHVLSIAGRLDAEHATVTYTAPGCQATVTLSRVHPGLL